MARTDRRRWRVFGRVVVRRPARLDDAALARGTTSAELALTVLRVVMRDSLIAAVIDDDDQQTGS